MNREDAVTQQPPPRWVTLPGPLRSLYDTAVVRSRGPAICSVRSLPRAIPTPYWAIDRSGSAAEQSTYLSMANPGMGRGFVDARDPQTPDTLLRQPSAESSPAL